MILVLIKYYSRGDDPRVEKIHYRTKWRSEKTLLLIDSFLLISAHSCCTLYILIKSPFLLFVK
jgi:hypothetical protein